MQGVPHEAIVDYPETKTVDLIAMGTHGRDGLERYVIGSVAERVVNTAPMPVLTLRAIDDTPTYPYGSVLVPTDGNARATTALRMGAEIAKRHGATLHLIAVLEEEILGSVDTRSDRERQARELLEEGESTVTDKGVADVVTAVESGSIPEEITEYTATHSQTGLDERLLSSISERVLRTASVPVLTTNRRDES